MIRVIIVLLCFMSVWSPNVANGVQQGDAGATISEGAAGATISGRVMIPGSRGVVPNAQISITGPDRTLIEVARGEKEMLIESDAAGEFEVTGMSTGSYEIRAIFPDDPERQPRDGGVSVELRGAAEVAYIEVWLPPRSEVSGRITAFDGTPVVGARVVLRQVVWDEGWELAGAEGSVGYRTDEEGMYSILAPPGEYLLEVVPVMGPGADVARFYPGGVYPEDAVPITLSGGRDVPGMNMVIEATEQLQVAFELPIDSLPSVSPGLRVAIGEAAAPIEAFIQPANRGAIRSPFARLSLTRIGSQEWVTSRLTPGEYELLINVSSEVTTAVDADWDLVNPLVRRSLSVDSQDSNITDEGVLHIGPIGTGTRSTIQGAVMLDEPAGGRVLDVVEEVRLLDVVFELGPRAQVQNDGSFILANVHPGLFRLSLPDGLPEGAYIESASSGGRDVLRDGLLVGGVVSPLQIVVATDGATLAGVIRDSEGELVPFARVVLIPPTMQRGRLQRFATTTANASGVYRLPAIPPGRYTAVAIDVAGVPEAGRPWEAPLFLSQIARFGKEIAVDPSRDHIADLDAMSEVY